MRETIDIISGLFIDAAHGWRHILPWFSLIAGFILGWGASMAANWVGSLIREAAKKGLRKNIDITVNPNPKVNSQQQSLWLVNIKTKVGFITFGLGKLSIKVYVKCVFSNFDRGTFTGNGYDFTSNVENRNANFLLFSSQLPKSIGVVYRAKIAGTLRPFDTVDDDELIGDWDMEIQVIEEDGELLYQRMFKSYIKNGNPNINEL